MPLVVDSELSVLDVGVSGSVADVVVTFTVDISDIVEEESDSCADKLLVVMVEYKVEVLTLVVAELEISASLEVELDTSENVASLVILV